MIKILTSRNVEVNVGISTLLKKVVDLLNRESGKVMSDSMTSTVKDHISNRYPGSTYWSPNKVHNGQGSKRIGETIVEIESAGRAYHDVTIRPIRAKCLTIPIHQSAYGKKAADFNDLFKPKGKNILARMQGNTLVAMFALAKSAFLRQDKSLMPSDDVLSDNIFTALAPTVNKAVANNVKII